MEMCICYGPIVQIAVGSPRASDIQIRVLCMLLCRSELFAWEPQLLMQSAESHLCVSSDFFDMKHQDEDGNVISEVEISPRLIQRHGVIKIFPGAKVHVHEIVIDGQSHVNGIMITGEALLITKKTRGKVIGGTINENGINGCLLVKATHVGSETTLS